MKNKVYKSEGLVIDLQDGQRVVFCRTDYGTFTPISIYTSDSYGAVANRWGFNHKGEDITREQVKNYFDGFPIKSIRQPKKLRIVCS